MRAKILLLAALGIVAASSAEATTYSDSYTGTTFTCTGTLDVPDSVAPLAPFTVHLNAQSTYGAVKYVLYRDATWSYGANHYVVATGTVLSTNFSFGSSISADVDQALPEGEYKYTLVVYVVGGHFYKPYLAVDAWVTVEDPSLLVDVDIKPGSCPNPLPLKGSGNAVVSVAILGSADFDATAVDPASVTLAGCGPVRWSVEDAASPVVGRETPCDCTTEGADGYPDLVLKFQRGDLVAAVGEAEDGALLTLVLTGVLWDGTRIEGSDCVLVRAK